VKPVDILPTLVFQVSVLDRNFVIDVHVFW